MKKRMAAGIATAGFCLLMPVAQAYEAGGVTGGGKVAGKVTFRGAAPAPRESGPQDPDSRPDPGSLPG